MKTLERVLALGLVAAVLLYFVSGPEHGRRNWEFLPDMAHSLAVESQAACALFPDGKALQPAPAGTVALGHLPLFLGDRPLDTTAEWDKLAPEAQADWNALPPPWPDEDARRAAVKRGEHVFTQFCAVCHGAGAEGNGPVTKRGVSPPPSLKTDEARAFSFGRIVRAVTCGKGNMPSYAAQVPMEDRWNAAAYLRILQGP